MILLTITDFFYLTLAIVDEEFLSKTVWIWDTMWAFAWLCILASLFWYYKLIHILSENSAEIYSKLLNVQNSMTEDYAEKYWNNILVKDKGELSEEDQLNTENIQDFKLVENRIDEIIKSAKGEITIFFCNVNTLKRKESKSILKFLKEITKSNILGRILFPLGVDDRIIDSYSKVASVRIFETPQNRIQDYIHSHWSFNPDG